VSLADVNIARMRTLDQRHKLFVLSLTALAPIVPRSVIHYPIRGFWRPRQVTESGRFSRIQGGVNEQQ
jgi:hypothetical protein